MQREMNMEDRTWIETLKPKAEAKNYSNAVIREAIFKKFPGIEESKETDSLYSILLGAISQRLHENSSISLPSIVHSLRAELDAKRKQSCERGGCYVSDELDAFAAYLNTNTDQDKAVGRVH